MSNQIKEYEELENSMTFSCELLLYYWLIDNFHPVIARYVYMANYVVPASNQSSEPGGYLDASSDWQLANHRPSYADGSTLTLKCRVDCSKRSTRVRSGSTDRSMSTSPFSGC